MFCNNVIIPLKFGIALYKNRVMPSSIMADTWLFSLILILTITLALLSLSISNVYALTAVNNTDFQ